jgi:hypothetical protein
MNAVIIISIIFMAVLTISGAYNYGKRSSEISLLHGFYEANSEFCDEACIKSFTFYIGNYCNGSYNTYLLMIGNDDEKIIINTPSSMKLSSKWVSSECDVYEFNAHFSDLDSELIPKNIILKFYPKSGKILLCGQPVCNAKSRSSDSTTIYGCLFKNCILTEIDIIKNKKLSSHAAKKISKSAAVDLSADIE